MANHKTTPTGRASPFAEDEIIVTKTDPKGRILYANEVFLSVSRMSLASVLGQPHSIVRHPDMPRCIFEMMWKTIAAGGEFFGYVKNMASNGDHYWVFAHVTPSRDAGGAITGFHSNRRKPDAAQIARIEPLYQRLLAAEHAQADRKAGQRQGAELLAAFLAERRLSYEQFAFSV
ncbi:PAS domain-containing protein [Roseomonas stagni]|uniref:PAS domain-containing protein n=1 Tax=Falsiroseomonas algicola TaxID=2716930 RepID=A0A6M1LJ84_9PROT|nr:PAS domain-containing protein [Falsiroseomonas algicola]NGM20373.1 PAS domain-containing protein [Falsiroseomonas algicola]